TVLYMTDIIGIKHEFRPDRIESVAYNAGSRIQNTQTIAGSQYQVMSRTLPDLPNGISSQGAIAGMINFELFPIKAIETIMRGGPNKTTLIHSKAINPGIG